MNLISLTTLLRYNHWANERILASCAKLTDGQFTQPVTPDPGWGNLRGILVHALDTEYGWRCVLQDDDSDVILEASDFASVAEVAERWSVERAAWDVYLASLSDDALQQGYGQNSAETMQVWQVIMHVLMHSGQHRSEIATILTGFGHSPGELDLAVFLKQRRDDAAP